MSQDAPPTEGENIASAIYEVSKSIDALVEVLSEKLTPKPETVRVFISDVPLGTGRLQDENDDNEKE